MNLIRSHIKTTLSLVVTFILLTLNAYTQNKEYAGEIIKTLASPSMYGRGYVNNGCGLAADYIVAKMKQLNLQPLGEGFKQDFPVKVNAYPKASVRIRGKELIPGSDFTIMAGSPSVIGHFKIKTIDSSYFTTLSKIDSLKKRDLRNTLIAFHTPLMKGNYRKSLDSLLRVNYIKCGGFIQISEKSDLTWSVYSPPFTLEYPVLNIVQKHLQKSSRLDLEIEMSDNENYLISNVIGYLPSSVGSDSLLVITAHYDHLGMLGNSYFPGANDNASGVAMMLDLAKEFSEAGNQKYNIAFMAFAGEEIGLLGSKYQSEHPYLDLDKIKFLINLDMVGTGSEGITMVNGEQLPGYFNQMVSINDESNYVSKVAKRGESCNSDHCPFYLKGVPAVFIYSMGKEHLAYHNLNDTYDKLPLTDYEDIFRLIRDFLYSF